MPMNLADMMKDDPDQDAVDSGEFITVETPTDAPADTSPGLSCVVCGTALTYGGRGPKPKYCEEHRKGSANKNLGGGGRRRSGGKDVEAAVAALDQAYNLLEMALMFAGAHGAMSTLRESIEGGNGRRGLRDQNRDYLTQDPELASRIASVGKVGGRYAFFAAQAATLGPVAILAMSEIQLRRRERAAHKTPDENPDVMPTNVYGMPMED